MLADTFESNKHYIPNYFKMLNAMSKGKRLYLKRKAYVVSGTKCLSHRFDVRVGKKHLKTYYNNKKTVFPFYFFFST